MKNIIIWLEISFSQDQIYIPNMCAISPCSSHDILSRILESIMAAESVKVSSDYIASHIWKAKDAVVMIWYFDV